MNAKFSVFARLDRFNLVAISEECRNLARIEQVRPYPLFFRSTIMQYRIVPTNSIPGVPSDGWRLNLPETIGRNTALPICIDDESISRSHCQLLLGLDESLQVRDLGSLNGTYINGERIAKQHSLAPGDTLQLGSVSLKIEFESDTNPGKPSRPKTKTAMKATQPMKSLPSSTFTMQEVKKEPKQWWEFWK